jgi:hypothetical protein
MANIMGQSKEQFNRSFHPLASQNRQMKQELEELNQQIILKEKQSYGKK